MIIQGLVALVVIVLSHELHFHDKEREIIKKCMPSLDFIRKTKKDKYTSYQFHVDGRMYDLRAVESMLKGYIGKPVRVFFDRVLTIRVYHSNLPTEVKFDEVEKGKIKLGIGLDGVIYHDFSKYPHMIIAGTTGYGKTNLIQTILNQLEGETVTLLDLKNDKRDYPVASARNIREAAEMLGSVSSGFVIVDEAAELLAPTFLTKKERRDYEYCQMVVSEIARMGRSRGISLIYCTQYPTSDVLPRQIKQNSEARIAFRTVTEVASRVALDEKGAEKLETGLLGRALYKTDRVVEMQTFLSEGSVSNACIRTKKKKGTRHNIEIG